MAAALETLLSQPALLALVIVGLTVSISAVLLSMRAVHQLTVQSGRLLGLARNGRADEARIQARQSTHDLAPLLAAFGGEVVRPPVRPVIRDVVAVAAVSTFPALATVACWQASLQTNAGDRITGLSAGFIALAILLPSATISAALILGFGRRGARVVRGAAVQLLANSVRMDVESDPAEVARRNRARDQRGD